MAVSDDFKQLIRAGNVAEALQLAFTEAIELTITTRLTRSEASEPPDAETTGPQIQTRINVLAGTVTTDVSSDIFTHETYAALGTLHSDQVRQGCQVIQENLANLQAFLETWIDAFGKSGQWSVAAVPSMATPPSEIVEPGPLSSPPAIPPPAMPDISPELTTGLGVAAIAAPPPAFEEVPPMAAPPLLDAGEATTIEARLIEESFEEETFIQPEEPKPELTDLSLPTPPTEEAEAAAAIAMDELFGEPQVLAVSQEAVEAAARELASAGANLGFEAETFIQELETPISPLAPEPDVPEVSEETFIQASEETFIQASEETFIQASEETLTQELEAPSPLEPPPPGLEALRAEMAEAIVEEPWEQAFTPPAAETAPEADILAEAADMVDDSWLQELGIATAETTVAPETGVPEAEFSLESEAPAEAEAGLEAVEFNLGLEPEAPAEAEAEFVAGLQASGFDFGLEPEAPAEAGLEAGFDLGLEPEVAPPSETDFGFATEISRPDSSPEIATDALVDALLQADEAAFPPEQPELEPLVPEPATAEPDWDELSAFADTETQPDPWEAVEAATPDWLAEEETPTSPLATSEILEGFDPSLFADESGEDLGAIGLESHAEDALLAALNEAEPASTPIAPPAEAALPSDLSLEAEAAFAEFDATLFPDETEMPETMPDLGTTALEERDISEAREDWGVLSEPEAMPAAETDPLAGLFSDTSLAEDEMEDFMPTAIPDAESTSATDEYDPLAALFDESASEDFANILEVPDALAEDDSLAAIDIDPFADELSDKDEPT